MTLKEFNLYNHYHLGDNVFSLHYFNMYKEENYKFNYYVQPEYINELRKHIRNSNIYLYDITKKIPENSYNMWIGENYFFHNYIVNNNYYDLFYVDFFKKVSQDLNIESKIKNKKDMLFDNTNFEISLNKNFDFLVINSKPLSKQLISYNEQEFIDLCNFLAKQNYKFITTQKVKNYECTRDYNMSLVDIGNLSNATDNIIAINTAPIITTFTTQNINNVNKRFIFDDVLTYSYNDRIIRLSRVNEIYKFL